MKQLSLLAIFCCLLSGFAGAVTISGTVTIGTSTGTLVVGQKVYVIDSFYTYSDSTVTDASGQYSFTLPGSIKNPSYYFLRAPACGVSNTRMVVYTGSSMTSNFVLSCTSFATLHGTIALGSGTTANNGLATLYLIRKQYDPVLLDTTLTAIDSIVTASTGGAYSKAYASMPAGTLLLKAALQSSHPHYSGYLPTYDTLSLNWSGATVLTTSNFAPANATNINLIAGTNPGGAGFIGGSVLLGANKNSGVGDPLGNRLLLLTTATGQAVAYTYSNAGGQFTFPNLGFGTYKLFGDAWGKTNPALSVTISAAAPSVSNVYFDENNKTFKGRIGLGVSNSNVLAGVSAYPNPVTDYVQFSGLNTISGSKTVVLSDVTGAVISRHNIEQGAAASISTATLPAGIYMLQLQTSAGNASFRIVK